MILRSPNSYLIIPNSLTPLPIDQDELCDGAMLQIIHNLRTNAQHIRNILMTIPLNQHLTNDLRITLIRHP
ncbi:MAG: hypothetical protein ACI4AK_06785 [Lepagella sp.]